MKRKSNDDIDKINDRYMTALLTQGAGMSTFELIRLCHDIHGVATEFAMRVQDYKKKFGELPEHDN